MQYQTRSTDKVNITKANIAPGLRKEGTYTLLRDNPQATILIGN
jgi:hypothetical protein